MYKYTYREKIFNIDIQGMGYFFMRASGHYK